MNLHDSWAGVCPLLGPASYVWVQGCRLRCRGCFNPETLAFVRVRLVAPATLAAELAAADARALVISGGEPFEQAASLAELCRLVRDRNAAIPILAYTGYTIEQLLEGSCEQLALVRQVDILVDGPFIAAKACDHPLLGSDNQRIWRLGDRVPHDSLARLDGPRVQAGWEPSGALRLVGTGARKADMGQLSRQIEARGVRLRRMGRHGD